MKILVTGADGYIGKNIAFFLSRQQHDVTVTLRRASAEVFFQAAGIHVLSIPDLNKAKPEQLQGFDVVIHAAGRAHKQERPSPETTQHHRQDNLELPLSLAQMCAQGGCSRFIQISSIGAQILEEEIKQKRLTLQKAWETHPYRAAKMVADHELLKFAQTSPSMQVVIVRLPLLYGKEAPGNFALLSKLVTKRIPLPLYGVKNKRAFLSMANLNHFIDLALTHPQASGEIWALRDKDEVSTTDFIKALADALGKPMPLLFPFPAPLLRLLGSALGKDTAVESLLGDLTIDLSKAEKQLGWTPPLSVKESLSKHLAPSERKLSGVSQLAPTA